jgi:hypothetical protein
MSLSHGSYLTLWYHIFLEKMKVTQLVKKFPAFVELKNSSPYSQNPITVPSPESL